MANLMLGVNIDHVATLRQARGTTYPCPIQAALDAEISGADGITLHLREDRRHIQDADVYRLKPLLKTRMNLEIAATDEMLAIATEVKPHYCCLVPEKREELTTEGGLDVVSHFHSIHQAVKTLQAAGIKVSLFIDADKAQIDAAVQTGAEVIELHTGAFAEAIHEKEQGALLAEIEQMAHYAHNKGLVVNAGHGLHIHNVAAIAKIPVIYELNIGHALVADAVVLGFREAVKQMKAIMVQARGND